MKEHFIINKDNTVGPSHWTYLLQILSELCFQRVAFSGNYRNVAISTDFIPTAIKIVLVQIVLVETILVGDPL